MSTLDDLLLANLRAENARLRAQLDASEQAARITELQAACTRHEAAAREARRALKPFAEVPASASVVRAHAWLTDDDFVEARRVYRMKGTP